MVPITGLIVTLTGIDDLARVAVVGIDAAQHTPILSRYTLDDNVARTTIRGAVAARTNHLAIIFSIKVLDADGTPAVELENLV